MASLSRFMLGIFCFLGFLNTINAQSSLLFTEDPEFLQSILDSVASGNIRFQLRTESDYPYSHRLNISPWPFLTLNTYGKAGREKEEYGSSLHFHSDNFSLSIGTVLVSHAQGWIVGKATSRTTLYPGNLRFKQPVSHRKGPYTSSSFSGFGSLSYDKYSLSFFSSDYGMGGSLGLSFPKRKFQFYHSPDQWEEVLIQIQGSHFLLKTNASYHINKRHYGHLSNDLTILYSGGGIIFLSYITADDFSPALGKNPWFGGDIAGCRGLGWGFKVKGPLKSTVQASFLQQTQKDSYHQKIEALLFFKIGNMVSESLVQLTTEQTLKEESQSPYLFTNTNNRIITIKQSFLLPLTSFWDIQSAWLVATNGKIPSSTGFILLTFQQKPFHVKLQLSHVIGGTTDLWYTRLYCGQQVVIQKARNKHLTALDITVLYSKNTWSIGGGFSVSPDEKRSILQLQIALNSANR
ncbi:MAG: hypothetical protein PHS99_02275 [Candidatus Marinimicrobia bacterium]|nr:hypothetical protein [Candidatus Neomarinimicrobiota bacterium]